MKAESWHVVQHAVISCSQLGKGSRQKSARAEEAKTSLLPCDDTSATTIFSPCCPIPEVLIHTRACNGGSYFQLKLFYR
jgi:hypothetical protein